MPRDRGKLPKAVNPAALSRHYLLRVNALKGWVRDVGNHIKF